MNTKHNYDIDPDVSAAVIQKFARRMEKYIALDYLKKHDDSTLEDSIMFARRDVQAFIDKNA